MKKAAKTNHDGNWYVLVAALGPPKEPLVLAPGLAIRRLPCPMTLFDLAAAGSVGFSAWGALQPFCNYLWAEIESAKDAEVSPGYDTLDRAWLVTALLVLRGFTPLRSIAYSSYTWGKIAGHQKRAKAQKGISLPHFNGSLLDLHLTSIIDMTPKVEVSEVDAKWVHQHFDPFNRLASESAKFRFALEAAVDWRFAKEPRSAVARIWSGIEALFEVNAELVFRLSLISACLLVPRGEARKVKFESVKKLYGFRSKIVHGEELTHEKLLEVVSDSFHLLKDLLLVSVEKGHALNAKDLEDAIFC